MLLSKSTFFPRIFYSKFSFQSFLRCLLVLERNVESIERPGVFLFSRSFGLKIKQFTSHSLKEETLISRIFPRDEGCAVNRILIKEINTILKCKCAFHRFNLLTEQEQGWAKNNETFHPSLFYRNKLHLIQKGNTKPSESIITATERRRKYWSKYPFQRDNKYNLFMKSYKMAVSL